MNNHKTKPLAPPTTTADVVPDNAIETVRDILGIPEKQSLRQVYDSEDFQSLLSEFRIETEGLIFKDLGIFEKYFITHPPVVDLLSVQIDYVFQRMRTQDSAGSYRKEIIEMAKTFDPTYAGFPVLSITGKDDEDAYLQDWQKRALALMLRGQFEYPAAKVRIDEKNLAKTFSSQFTKKDNMRAYDRFKNELADKSEKHWAMQNCFDRLGVTVYPFAEPPVLTGLGDITKAMYDKTLNPNEKNLPFSQKRFSNFVRAVAVFRRVWPELGKSEIQGSFIRGLVAIIAMFDNNILKGSDEWLVDVFIEAKDPSLQILKDEDNINFVGFKSPSTWTNRKNWQGNRFYQNAAQSFAKVWNSVRANRKKWKLPKLSENPINGLDNAKFLDMVIDE